MTAGQFREKHGGNVALRGIGMAIFARAYLYCQAHGVDFGTMAARLGTIDWSLLSCEREDLPNDAAAYASAVQAAVLPMWAHLLAVAEGGYRVRSSSDDADAAWSKIEAQLFSQERDQAAA